MRDDRPNHRWLRTPRQNVISGLTLVFATVLSIMLIAVVSWLGPAEAAIRIVGAFR